MKRLFFLVIFIFSAALLAGTSDSQAATPRIRKLQKKNSVKIYCNDEQILAARRLEASGTPADNGYYMVSFELPNTQQTCFLTGLTQSNLNTVQNKLIKSYKEDEDFSIEDLNFIDAEKDYEEGREDTLLCWAGAVSDMLHYTGWGKKAGFATEDDLFDLYAETFYDRGGFFSAGIGWFFNKVDYGVNYDLGPFKEGMEDKNGGYLMDYAFDEVCEEYRFSSFPGKESAQAPAMMKKMTEVLKAGDAVGLSVESGENAHAITLFGFVEDAAYKKSNLKHYPAIIVADSDNGIAYTGERRDSPNTYTLLHTKPQPREEGEEGKELNLPNYGFILRAMTTLKSVSHATQEKDAAATKDKKTTPDLRVSKIIVSNSTPGRLASQKLASGEDIYTGIEVYNFADVDLRGIYTVRVTLMDKDGKTLQTFDEDVKADTKKDTGTGDVVLNTPMKGVAAGTYRIRVTLNPEHKLKEAYYTNNTFETEINVADATIDTTGIAISAKLPDFGDQNQVEATLTYKGENIIKNNNYVAELSLAYINEDGKLPEWNFLCDTEKGEVEPVGAYQRKLMSAGQDYHALSRSTTLFKEGKKVRFRLAISKGSEPPVYVYSPIYDLRYSSLGFERVNEDLELSPLESGETHLKDGEQIRIRITNDSTYDSGSYTGYYKAEIDLGDEQVVVVPETQVTLGYGEKTDEIIIDSWEKPVYGIYSINLYVAGPDKEYMFCGLVDTIRAKEKRGVDVNTMEDLVDPYDGATSLREAVSYAEETGQNITFEGYVTPEEPIQLESSIEISKRVRIDGFFKISDFPMARAIESKNGKPTFIVKEGATLILRGLGFTCTKNKTTALIENQGGSVSLDRCHIDNIISPTDGGAILTTGGEVKISNSIINNCLAPRGGAIFAKDAKVSVVNSYFTGNRIRNTEDATDAGEGMVLYATGGDVSVVTSTMIDNGNFSDGFQDEYGEITDPTSGIGSTVYGDKNCRLLDCAFAENKTLVDVDGEAAVYGSFLTSTGQKVTRDQLTRQGTTGDLFVIRGDVIFTDYVDDPWVLDYPYISQVYFRLGQRKVKGVYLRITGGKLEYSEDGTNYLPTDIDAVFAQATYGKDIFGAKRSFQYGAFATYYQNPNKKKIGYTPVALSGVINKGKPIETTLGHALTDAMAADCCADIVLLANRFIKKSIPKGDVTYGQLRKVLPNSWNIEVRLMTGKQILSVLEKSLDLSLRGKKKKKNAPKAFQIGNAEIRYKASAKKGKRIKKVTLGGMKLRKNDEYRVAMYVDEALAKTYPELMEATFDEHYDPIDTAFRKFLNWPKSEIKAVVKQKRWVAVK